MRTQYASTRVEAGEGRRCEPIVGTGDLDRMSHHLLVRSSAHLFGLCDEELVTRQLHFSATPERKSPSTLHHRTQSFRPLAARMAE